MLAPHAAEQMVSAEPSERAFTGSPSTPACRRLCRAGARARARARAADFGRHPRGRQCKRPGARARRLGRLLRRQPRRPGGHDARAALARLHAQAVHLRARLRGRLVASGNADRRQAAALRQLHAGEFRSDVPGHGDGAPRVAIVAQRAGHRGARQSRRQPPERAAHANRRRAGAAERARRPALPWGSAASACGSTIWRCSIPGLARLGSARAADRARGGGAPSAAPAARSGRRLVCRQYPDRRAAAGQRAARTHRLQDRHVLRLSRRLGGRLRRPHDHRRLGRAAGRRAGARAGRPRVGGADLVRRLRAQRQCAGPLAHAPKGAVFAATNKLPPPLQRFGSDGAPSGVSEPPRIMFPPDGARLELDRRPRPIRWRSRSPAAARRSPSWSMACRWRRKAAGAPCSSSPTGRASRG